MKIFRLISLLIVSLSIYTIPLGNLIDKEVLAAEETGFKWLKNDTMDELLEIINNKAGDDEIFVKWDVEKFGTYTLEYYLEDHIKTILNFQRTNDFLKVDYSIFDESQGEYITQNEVDQYYGEMDYDLIVPELKSIEKTVTDGVISFQILKGASSKYPGKSFNINNLNVRFKWDIQTDTLYFLTKGVEKGNIVPFKLTGPEQESETLNILRAFEEFVIEPTHWIEEYDENDEIVGNKDLKTIEIPESDIRPGSRPGLRISFKQPKVFTEDHTYETATDDLDGIQAVIDLAEIGSNEYTDFTLMLNPTSGEPDAKKIINPPNLGDDEDQNNLVEYNYENSTYIIELVDDRRKLINGDNLFLRWQSLDPSKIYSVQITLDESEDFEFDSYEPENEYAYTYLEYAIERASMEDAYLDIAPYAGSQEDDLEYTVYYSKSYKTEFDEDDIWLKHYHSKQYTDSNIYIPVPFRNGSNQEYYQVGVKFAGTPLRSQAIKYVPVEDDDVPPPVPRISAIKNLAVVPSENDPDEPSKVQFDLIWEAPTNTLDNPLLEEMLSNGKIYYELLFNDVPGETNNKFNIIKVFEASMGEDGIQLEEINTGKDTGEGYSSNGYTKGYNVNKNLFAIKDIVIKDEDGWSNIPEKTIESDDISYTGGSTQYMYEFPGVNFIRMRAIYVTDTGIGESEKSIADSISLSTIRYEIPIIGELDYTPITVLDETEPLGIDINWDRVDITEYTRHMLYPLGKSVDEIIYRVYISEDKSKLLEFNIQDLPAENGVEFNIPLEEEDLVKLRSKEVLYSDIIDGKTSTDILGVDPNTNYYVRVVTRLKVTDEESNSEILSSEPSNVLSMTTPVIPKEPNQDELIPLAPENTFVDYSNESMISADVYWEFPKEVTLEDGIFGFEIISIEDRSLPSNLDGRGIRVEEIVESEALEDNVQGWKLLVEDGHYILKSYEKEDDIYQWVESEEEFEVDGNTVTLVDANNMTNKVYYYYVRTVTMQSGTTDVASSWAKDTLTTAPIKSPINLIVEYQSEYNYDPKTEAIIRFDAPIPVGSDLNNEYINEVFIKGDNDKDYSKTKYTSEFLDEVEGANDGYIRLYYKVENLEPGESYSIKVRIEDRTKGLDKLPDGTLTYPKSNFSERVTTRTEFDQEDYDKDNKYIEYVEYYISRAQELKEKPYWEVEKNGLIITKYRGEYSSGELKFTSSSNYQLLNHNQITHTYYLPAEFIETANDEGVTLIFNDNTNQVGIRPYTISKDQTQEIMDKIDEINEYDSSAKDYYIKLSINIGDYNAKINGKKPASDLINVEMQVVGSKKSEEDLEGDILYKLDVAINENKSELIKDLKEELVDGIDDSKLLKIVTDTLELVKEDHKNYTETLIDQYIQEEYLTIENIEKPLYIAIKVDNTNQMIAYKKYGSVWKEVTSRASGNIYDIEAKELGSYIILPISNMYKKLDDLYSGLVTDAIVRYNLMEVFTTNELQNMNSNVDKYQLISSVARLLGAQRGEDTIAYLQSKDINISGSNLYENVTREETVDLLMQVYQVMHNIKLETVQIQSYYLIEDIEDINEMYVDTILRGSNLGIVKLDEGRFNPNEVINLEELLETITRVVNKIDW